MTRMTRSQALRTYLAIAVLMPGLFCEIKAIVVFLSLGADVGSGWKWLSAGLACLAIGLALISWERP